MPILSGLVITAFVVWVAYELGTRAYARIRRNQLTEPSSVEFWIDHTGTTFESEEEQAAQMADPSTAPPDVIT